MEESNTFLAQSRAIFYGSAGSAGLRAAAGTEQRRARRRFGEKLLPARARDMSGVSSGAQILEQQEELAAIPGGDALL